MCVYTGACASIPLDYPKTPSSALPPSNQTRLWNGLNSQAEQHAGQSAFFLIPSGMDAFLSRYFLIEAADRTLDLQYYMFHDKVFIADNTVAIVGGRNLGNEYFDASSNVNFSDLDILMTGLITRQVSTAFDEYWNSEAAVPIEALVSSKPGIDDLKEGQRILQVNRESLKDSEYAKGVKESDLLSRLIAGNVPVVWAEGVFLSDRPIKVKTSSEQDPSAYMAPRLQTYARGVKSEDIRISTSATIC